MGLDQEQKQPAAESAGWAFGKNSLKAHYFNQACFTSLCGKAVAYNFRQRNDRRPYTSDCVRCQNEWHALREPPKND